MIATFLPSVLVPLVVLVFPAIAIRVTFLYVETEFAGLFFFIFSIVFIKR
jgi:photosystem I reaction center subunit VIII